MLIVCRTFISICCCRTLAGITELRWNRSICHHLAAGGSRTLLAGIPNCVGLLAWRGVAADVNFVSTSAVK
jgi:hypothetical protein